MDFELRGTDRKSESSDRQIKAFRAFVLKISFVWLRVLDFIYSKLIKTDSETKGDIRKSERHQVATCVSLWPPVSAQGGLRCVCVHNRAANRPIRDERV